LADVPEPQKPADDAAAEAEAEALGLRGGLLDRFLTPRASYVLVRFTILRLLGVVYFAAFLSAALQLVPLLGPDGLVPAQLHIDGLIAEVGGPLAASRQLPTLFLWTGASNADLQLVAWCGVALSALLVVGLSNAAQLALMWLLYLSIVNVGGVFYGYGWEIQLLETGLLAVFLCPLASVHPFPRTPPPVLVIWLFRWLVVRIMLGAGLIKLRGDTCWTDLTCLQFHYETQPIPGPLSPYLHALPRWVHGIGVLVNHIVELLAPLFAFGPARARRVAGILFVLFQVTLILSGNLAFLNWLTLVPAIACFDDADLRRVLPGSFVRWAERRTTARTASPSALWTSGAYGLAVLILSINPIANLFSSAQAMNQSFDPVHVVNTYGAFGDVNRERIEVIVQGSLEDDPGVEEAWKDYELPCKPGALDRGLCWLTPYHRRLDWQMWFLPFRAADRSPWFIHFIAKLLAGDPVIRQQLARDPFDGKPPKWIRAELYRYRFATSGGVWRREHVGGYLRTMNREDPELLDYLAAHRLPTDLVPSKQAQD